MCDTITIPLHEMESYEPAPRPAEEELRIMVGRKNYRGYKMSRARKQNQIAYDDFHDWLNTGVTYDDRTECLLFDWRYAVNTCCHHTLVREHKDGACEFMAAKTCKHKFCAICNERRAKEVRRKYRQLFERNPNLIHEYDFFHLTLTVPHSQTEGYKGDRFYGPELMRLFNFMRKKKWWKNMVYAGEFGLEITKGKNGLHIHIHSMLLVRKSIQNRNTLHKEILLHWNRATSGAGTRKEFTNEEIESILKGNQNLTRLEVEMMDPTGATVIGLESLYVKSNEKKRGFKYCERSGFYKRYVRPSDKFDRFMGGVMECIKYHFEPMALKKDGKMDFDLLAEILPAVSGKPMYRKFGAFHSGTKNAHPDAKILNFNHKLDDIEKDVEETANDTVYHPETLKPVDTSQYSYVITSLASLYFDKENHFRFRLSDRAKRRRLKSDNLTDALKEMTMLDINGNMAKKNAWQKVRKRA